MPDREVHADGAATDASLVRRLLAARFRSSGNVGSGYPPGAYAPMATGTTAAVLFYLPPARGDGLRGEKDGVKPARRASRRPAPRPRSRR